MKCPTCDGTGVVLQRREVNILGLFPLWDEVVYQQCPRCGGSGTVPETEKP